MSSSTPDAAAALQADPVSAAYALVFPEGARALSPDDLQRWHSQGFKLDDALRIALAQQTGGPCGVLAAVQAAMLCRLLFGSGPGQAPSSNSASTSASGAAGAGAGSELGRAVAAALRDPGFVSEEVLSETDRRDALIGGMTDILFQALPEDTSGEGGAFPTLVTVRNPQGATPAERFAVQSGENNPALRTRAGVSKFLRSHFPELRSDLGVLMFVLSVVLSRGTRRCRDDMDDIDGALTGEFGHCSQEMLNLLLTGAATSQVLDGIVDLAESGMKLHGVLARPQVGYLSLLESLRYTTVGSYYKSPVLPIWVVGSETHYTVLFAADPDADKHSDAEVLLNTCKRAFQARDAHESGFIATADLQQVLLDLGLEQGKSSDEVAAITKKCEMPDAGIILWADFFREVAPLMRGGGRGHRGQCP